MKGLKQLRIYAKNFYDSTGYDPLYLQFKEGLKRVTALEVFEIIALGEQGVLWEVFVDRGMQIRVILSESPKVLYLLNLLLSSRDNWYRILNPSYII
jgi:hypothetical protein